MVSEPLINRERKHLTRIQRWPETWYLSLDHLRLDTVDVIGFSMGAGTAARLLLLHPPQLKSAILVGFGDYAIEDHVMEFPKNWPVPDSVPRPITARVWLEEGAKGDYAHNRLVMRWDEKVDPRSRIALSYR